MESKKNIIGIIPSRMGSSRYPEKAMAEIHGLPMVGHVYKRAKMSKLLSEVYVTTPDQEITDYIDSIGGKWVKDKQKSYRGCSNATADAMLSVEELTGEKVDIVVLIQGDEPMTTPEMIDMAVQPLLYDPAIEVVNLMTPIGSTEEHLSPNCVKVVVDQKNFALYFSREPIPSSKKYSGGVYPKYKQVCVMPFTREFILKYSAWEPSPLEEIESIDMNRVLEYGHKVKMVYEEFETYPVDTAEDLERVKEKMASDPLLKTYARN